MACIRGLRWVNAWLLVDISTMTWSTTQQESFTQLIDSRCELDQNTSNVAGFPAVDAKLDIADVPVLSSTVRNSAITTRPGRGD